MNHSDDGDSMEIVTELRQPWFQMKFSGLMRVDIKGVFYNKDSVFIADDEHGGDNEAFRQCCHGLIYAEENF
jgi:hypothetical protein